MGSTFSGQSTVDSRQRLKAHDPALAVLLRHAYGDGAWRYGDAMLSEAGRETWRALRAKEPPAVPRDDLPGLAQPQQQSGLDAVMRPPQNQEEEERMLAMAVAASMESA